MNTRFVSPRGVATTATLFLFATSLSHGMPAKLHTSVLTELAKMEACLQKGSYAEAKARAEAVWAPRGLTYAIDESNLSLGQIPVVRDAVQRAVQTWSVSLDEPGFFQPETLARANVVFAFVPKVRYNGGCAAGYAVWSRRVTDWGAGHFTSRISASLQIALNDQSGKPIKGSALAHAAMHELGHVLGLADSPKIGAVMGPMVPGRTPSQPEPIEAEAVASLRDEATSYGRASEQFLAIRAQNR
ncbi:MAG: matrixin family metalloprotease [Fimbriimonadaceae bacterium]|nr:matrixin family metalloprotease [Fimbriimonadaceae bacterium]QYK56341.1 MAG: matrixin family metalloprotease [Fimbriimonadaceae bacterium]